MVRGVLFLGLLFILWISPAITQAQRSKVNPSRIVSGMITDSLNRPLYGGYIKLTSKLDNLVSHADRSGYFEFPAVKSRKFKLTIRYIGFNDYTRRYKIKKKQEKFEVPTIRLAPQIILIDDSVVGELMNKIK